MTTWKRADPRHQPLRCSAGNHLWKQGLAYAIYNKAGELTRGGTEPRTFFCSRTSLQAFFNASKSGVDKAVVFLIKYGWFKATSRKKHFQYINHEIWVQRHPGKCVVRDLLPFQEEVDPFISELYAVAQGSLRLQPHWVASVRQCASDDEILREFIEQRRVDLARRLSGDANNTSPANSFYTVCEKLKALYRQRLRTEKAVEI